MRQFFARWHLKMESRILRSKKRVIALFFIFCLFLAALVLRLGWIQIVMGDHYGRLALEQQTTDIEIPAKRGIIFDRNGKEMAVSALTHTIWVRPGDVVAGAKDEEASIRQHKLAAKLAEILETDEEEIMSVLRSERTLVKVAKYVEKDKANLIREANLTGISIQEDVRRSYPLGAFAAHLIGSTTDDNRGLSGIELKYEKYLSGKPGRWIKNTDVAGADLSHGIRKYFPPEDGYSIMLTIDEVIQHFVEKNIEAVMERTKAKRVFCLIMDPKTGDIIAMASTPDFDPNNPRVPLDEDEAAKLELLSDDEKIAFWNDMWRNPMINDTYEPGSTFKLITTSMVLEESAVKPGEKFTCKGSINIGNTKLSCWRTGHPHGAQTLVEAVQNSCNPVFVQLSQRLGINTYYNYLRRFGLMEKTGIDFPGEGNNIIQKKDSAGPVGLATMAYGQGIAVTPISLLTAVSALGNEGILMEPRLVRGFADSEGNLIEEIPPKKIRQAVSAQTANEMCLIMESVVSEGGGGAAAVQGYRIGGKTGTANKVVGGAYVNDTYSSFIGMVPMDNPQLAILLVVDSPQGVKFGSVTAAPGVKAILQESLKYLKMETSYSEKELEAMKKKQVTVPDVTGENFSEGIGILAGAGLSYKTMPEGYTEDFSIVDQYPKPGERVDRGSQIILYSR